MLSLKVDKVLNKRMPHDPGAGHFASGQEQERTIQEYKDKAAECRSACMRMILEQVAGR